MFRFRVEANLNQISKLFMGKTYLYNCPRCGYRAKVSGVVDDGFGRIIQTIECCDCKELYDVPIRVRATDAEVRARRNIWGKKPFTTIAGGCDPSLFSVLADKMLTVGLTQTKWFVLKPVCPVSGLHRTRPWKEPGKCPRCGTWLERTLIPYRIWD